MWKFLRKWVVFWKNQDDFSDNYIECLVQVPGNKNLSPVKCEVTGKTFGFHLQVIVPSKSDDPDMLMLVQEGQCLNSKKFWKLLKKYNTELEQYRWEDGTPFIPGEK